jgi:signal transduction histidine kinase/PAS domain-containing protein
MTQITSTFLRDGGHMGERIRDFPWHETPLGPPEAWPTSLKVAVSVLLQCQLPMYIAWGPQLVQIYNDAYRPILGDKHPAALGASTPHTWDEIWPTIGPMWQQVLKGQPIGFDDFKLTIERYGYPEDCYFNFSYSPVPDDEGRIAGVLVTFAETTQRVKSERRLKFLDDLGQATRSISDPAEVMRVAARMLGEYLGVNRCAYAHVHADQNGFDLIGDHNVDVSSIVGRYRFTDFGELVHRLMLEGKPYVNDDVDQHPATKDSDLSAYRATQIQAVVCVPLLREGRFVAAMAVHQSRPRHWTHDEVELVRTVVDRCWEAMERLRVEAALREQARTLQLLNGVGATLAAELDIRQVLQRVTDAATEMTGAQFGAFFYNGVDAQGEAYLLYTLSGAPREKFENLGHPRPTALFGPTFRGEPPLRIDDVLADPRYGQWGPHHGMPPGHIPVRSYLAVPVISRSSEVLGGLFFGHPRPGVFTERSEQLAVGIAAHAAIAIDNARLYEQSQRAAEERSKLLESERAARAEAERASATKDEFLATLSHELRTPLSAITGWAEILRRKIHPDQPDLLKGVEVIARSTRMQAQLIDDLLDMSRITAGKLRLEMQPVSAVAFVQAAVDVIRPAAEAAGIELMLALDASESVYGDASRLQQVVWNLLANAVKFTPRGGSIGVRLYKKSGEVACITVEDTGAGIRRDMLEQIFDRFRQVDGSITRKYGGLGLGLSIVKSLVDLHGGKVSAFSEGEGRGARFVVELPVWASGNVEREARAPVPLGGNLNGARIMIVDDEPDARDMLERILQESGAGVVCAPDAETALREFATRPLDVIVSDIGMPGMDGYELMRRIRRNGAREMPAIALTAFARPEDRERALQAGFDEHMIKPVDPYRLVERIAALLER